MTLLKSVATLICPILIVADIRIERIPRGYEPRMLPLHSSAILFLLDIIKELSAIMPSNRQHDHRHTKKRYKMNKKYQ